MAVSNNGDTGTASAILDIAERLVQTRGFNAFSYADVAAELGITKPALHYHFAGKAELGEALVARYTTRFSEALESDRRRGADAASTQVGGLRRPLLRKCWPRTGCACAGCWRPTTTPCLNRCERPSISFFDHNETWLAGVIDQGRDEARTLEVEGGQAGGRPHDHRRPRRSDARRPTYLDPDRFASSARRLLAELVAR